MLRDLFTNQQRVTRRQLFGSAAQGIGGITLASLLGEGSAGTATASKGGMPQLPHFAPRAKRMVWLSTMSSGNKQWPITPAVKPFKRFGQCGTEFSEMLPNIGSLADDICVVRFMNTEAVNNTPGVTSFMTGAQVPGRPSLDGWLSYGLGCESSDLPAFVAMTSSDKERTCGQLFYDYYWGSGFLPSRFQ
jgi:hypothetical protein